MSIFGFGKSYAPDGDVGLLTTVYDFGMRSVVESILRDAGIKYIIVERGGSVPVITGSSMFGADFFVSNAELEDAKELIASLGEDRDDDDGESEQ